jgi:hypothetical protein
VAILPFATAVIFGFAFVFDQYDLNWFLGIAIGFIISWIYWAITIPIWRRWALKNGVDKYELSRWGEMTGLTYKEGSWLSKTEFRRKDER